MRYKGEYAITVESRIGLLQIRRGYYYCEHCQSGFFPLDQQLHWADRHWSEGVVKMAVWLSGLVAYEDVARILEQVGGIPISPATVWRLVQEWGERFREREEREWQAANEVPLKEGWEEAQPADPGIGGMPPSAPLLREKPSGSPGGGVKRMGVAMDGGMIHVRGEGWKELKVGCIFDVGKRRMVDKETGEEIEVAGAINASYVAHLGGPEVFGKKVWAEAQRRGWEKSPETEALGDGAAWIWNLVEEHFYDSYPLVDWYHAAEHLAAAANALWGEGTAEAQRWLKSQETVLYQGHALRIARQLEEAAQRQPERAERLLEEARYFRNNHRRMNYMEMREEGWVIGSGVVESGVKQFRARFAGPGMRWSRLGAERLLPIRAAVMSGRFDQWWPQVYAAPKN
jgi:hypothetical protein